MSRWKSKDHLEWPFFPSEIEEISNFLTAFDKKSGGESMKISIFPEFFVSRFEDRWILLLAVFEVWIKMLLDLSWHLFGLPLPDEPSPLVCDTKQETHRNARRSPGYLLEIFSNPATKETRCRTISSTSQENTPWRPTSTPERSKTSPPCPSGTLEVGHHVEAVLHRSNSKYVDVTSPIKWAKEDDAKGTQAFARTNVIS